ncbi:hypothetical protein ACROYT_G011117 [Oculina patagonica]
MAAKRKVEETDDKDENLSSLQHKRHENTTPHEITTNYSTEHAYGSQWYEQRGPWIALYDWNSGLYYYQNVSDYRTQWEKPAEWDSIHPLYIPANQYSYHGFYNEPANASNSDTNHEENFKQTCADVEAKVERLVTRPARRQIDPEEREKLHWIPEGATEYNIWYDRWVGEHWRADKDHGPSETKCCIETDAGFTKANVYDPGGNKHYYCIYFARGCCHLGSECGYLHVIPTDKDEKRIDLAHDVFGRERHRLHKDDMGGVGTFDKECRTLYVGGLGHRATLEKVLWTEFGEWGQIEDIRIIPKRNIAFVRYKNRVNAEFAKIAMSDQKLDSRELLNVRWAFDDPNPKARKEELLRSKQRVLEAASERGLLQKALLRPTCPPGAQVTGPYPNTDDQYPVECGPLTKEHFEQAEVLQNVYTDCTRLDEALKKVEAIHSKETESSKTNSHQTTDTAHQYSDEYSNNENKETSGTDWSNYDYYKGYNSYDYGQTWDYSQHYQPEESCSTQDPYRQNLASKNEASSDREPTGQRLSSDAYPTETPSSEREPTV